MDMDKDLLQAASTAQNLSDYIRRNGHSPGWGESEWLIVQKQAEAILDHVRMAHGGKLPSEITAGVLATGG